jgi:hypothetical protein
MSEMKKVCKTLEEVSDLATLMCVRKLLHRWHYIMEQVELNMADKKITASC